MRKWLIMGVVAVGTAGIAGTAFANYFWPGRVIIGTGIISGGSTTGSSLGLDAGKAMGGPDVCEVAKPIECECFPGMPVLEACLHSGVELGCLKPDTPYDALKQDGPVVIQDGSMRLGGVICSGKVDGEALINLP